MSTSLYLLTYNCNKRVQDKDTFISRISNTFPTKPATLYVFGFEELCSTLDGAFSYVANEHLIKLNEILIEALIQKYGLDLSFQTLAINHIGAIGITLISPISSKFSNVRKANASCGYLYSSLKGATGVRLSYKDRDGLLSDFTFANAHLTANEGDSYWLNRNKDVLNLMRGLDFSDGFGFLKPKSHSFFMGDLNYRTQRNLFSNGNGEEIEIDYEEDLDELAISKENGEIFQGFDEAKILFNPTYKFNIGSEIFNTKRFPSWCDRILFQSTYTESPTLHKYNSIKGILSSDHQPVYLSIDVPLQPPSPIINKHGYLTDDTHISGQIYMIPNFRDKIISKLSPISDAFIGYGLYSLTDGKGRVYGVLFLAFLYLLSQYL